MNTIVQSIWGKEVMGKPFVPFTLPHLLGILSIAFGLYTLIKNRHKLTNPILRRKIEVGIASTLAAQQTTLYTWYTTSGNFSIAESLPLYSCRMAIIGSIYMILKRSYKAFEIIYFWGLVGAFIALITPDTSGFNFPHIMLVQYFVGHGSLILGIVYMMLAYNFKPTKDSLFRTYKITSIYFVLIYFVNKFVGGNYSYLNGKPHTPTLLDALPPYPFYIPVILISMFVLFFIAYMPFMMKRKENAAVLRVHS